MRQTVDAQSVAASTKDEQMGKPLIVHQVAMSYSVWICAMIYIYVRLHHSTSVPVVDRPRAAAIVKAGLLPQAVS